MDLSQAYAGLALDMGHTLPLLLVMLSGLVLVVFDAFKPNHRAIQWVTSATLLIAFLLAWSNLSAGAGTAYYAMLRYGGMASFVNLIILGSALLSVLLMGPYFERIGSRVGEVYSLILFATGGMMVLGTANHLVMTFVGLETMSICLYILTAIVRTSPGSKEGALKYFLLGAFATGFFLYGIALLYGATGTMYLHEMSSAIRSQDNQIMFWAGVALLLIGFLFKVSAVPFHMWTPDVYQSAPTPITGYMSTASKTAAFASLILVLYLALPSEHWSGVLAIIALITMILGNVVAISQRNVKRMLAYSSVAHAGYILVGLSAGSPAGYSGALFYLVVYSVMNIGAFGVISILEWDQKEGSEQTLDSLAGVGYRKPLLGWSMVFFMFSLAGFPPLAGFFGKVAVFAPAIDAGLTWLAIAGVLTSAISAYYYLRVLVVFFMKTPASDEDASRPYSVPTLSAAVLVFCVLVLIVLGVAPGILSITSSFFTGGSLAMLW
jgi:NADH-quinone oxidoreductase subunit N